MKINLTFARLLLQLKEGTKLKGGLFQGSNRKMLELFLTDGVLDYILVGTQQRRVFCPNQENLEAYLNRFNIPSLENYILFLEKDTYERSDAAKAVADSKFRKVKIYGGFLVNNYAPLDAILEGKQITLSAPGGSFLFIHNYKELVIPSDVVVIIVENFENFKYIERQHYLFEGQKPLFIWRYQNSNDIAEWLELISNPFIYFGDFDPKGVHIYITEFKNKISKDKGRFFVPEFIEELFDRHGDGELFINQMDNLKDFNFDSFVEIIPLINLIKKHKKGLAQEVLIRAIS